MTETVESTDSADGEGLKTFRNYGAIGGVVFGLVAGLLAAGPHFQTWPASQSWTVIGSCALGFGVVCHCFVGLMASLAAAGERDGVDGDSPHDGSDAATNAGDSGSTV